eukprot:CAMPEP_0206032706 /NCGR_PEP_ID=MMETSP1466-20131121/135_1 /ASSEMBLY_ACC=CAM_ASM_001126 /TAXON_ID=44452 /ORGANISM="Pavlova gyrans, Strain CCMP608" /LENGTH=140 /DNA_ID=CAMNT_0053406843 /DNA_START=436 /DNA_END=855 /DNA_ORIENTATION=+
MQCLHLAWARSAFASWVGDVCIQGTHGGCVLKRLQRPSCATLCFRCGEALAQEVVRPVVGELRSWDGGHLTPSVRCVVQAELCIPAVSRGARGRLRRDAHVEMRQNASLRPEMGVEGHGTGSTRLAVTRDGRQHDALEWK